MKCPKCGYNSFDDLESCKKCGVDLSGHKARYWLHFPAIRRQKRALDTAPPAAEVSASEAGSTKDPAGATGTQSLFEAGPRSGEGSDVEDPFDIKGSRTDEPEEVLAAEELPGPATAAAPFVIGEEAEAPLLETGEFDFSLEPPEATPATGQSATSEDSWWVEEFDGPAGETAESGQETEGVGSACSSTGSFADSESSFAMPADGLPPVAAAAPLAPRLAASGLDLLVLGLTYITFVIAGGVVLFPDGGGPRLNPAILLDLSIPYFLVFFTVAFGYFTLFHFLTGQTPGKMLLRLRVEGTDGEPLLFSQAFLRSIGGLLSLLAAGAGFLSILLDPDRRGWNDRMAGSRVVPAGLETEDALQEGISPEEPEPA